MHSIAEPSDGIISKKSKFYYKSWIYPKIKNELSIYHKNSEIWFIGNLLTYLIKPNDYLSKTISEIKQRINFKSGIVG